MDKKICYVIVIVLLLSYFFTIIFFSIDLKEEKPSEDITSKVVVEFFYTDGCKPCEDAKIIINNIEQYYTTNKNVSILRLSLPENNEKFYNYGFKSKPGVVVKNLSYQEEPTIIPNEQINEINIKDTIERHLTGNYTNESILTKNTKIQTIFGELDYSEISLPIITMVIGLVDSVNPCSFFILLFLLSLLLYTKSRKRMLLIGSIFIFFSGFYYFLLMTAILNVVLIVKQTLIIAIIAGIVALTFGGLNIKDFFFFKKGVSASIPESKKPKLYKQMSKIVKITSIPSLIISTIILAISANTVELLCSFNLPLIYTGTILPLYHLNQFDNYLYIFFYNIMYVLPLLIIVLVVVVTLGRKKLTEFQGRILKLFSGLMVFSLGLILIINVDRLENIFLTLAILLVSLILTFAISFIWKKCSMDQKPEEVLHQR